MLVNKADELVSSQAVCFVVTGNNQRAAQTLRISICGNVRRDAA